jgi:redox-sensitive bicupin YhaK (pirin superfamily)
MIDLNDLYYFATLAERGSFTAAADAIGIPKGTLSRRLKTLEDQLGLRLIDRTTRRFALTEAGKKLYHYARVAGQWQGLCSPAALPTPFLLLDAFLEDRAKISHVVPEDWHATIFVVRGILHVTDQTGHRKLSMGQAMAVSGATALELAGDSVGTHVVLLSGPALREPIAKHGPFVMNSQAELVDRIRAYEAGELGRIDLLAP